MRQEPAAAGPREVLRPRGRTQSPSLNPSPPGTLGGSFVMEIAVGINCCQIYEGALLAVLSIIAEKFLLLS